MYKHFKSEINLVGLRIISDGYYGTVKYVGPVQPTKGVWYGIEWDDCSRGKHDGTHEGVQYFQASTPTSGSFVRSPKVNHGRTFMEALEERYGLVDDEHAGVIQEDMFVKGKNQTTIVEVVGAKSVNMKQSTFERLLDLGLREEMINGTTPDDQIKKKVPNVKEINLSKNLLPSWESVADITGQLIQLELLNVSENRLSIPTDPSQLKEAFSQLKILFLNRMNYTWEQILQCWTMWPKVEQLHVCFNRIVSVSDLPSSSLNHIKLINLESNHLDGWSSILKLGHLPQLETLILNNTQLEKISFDEEEPGEKLSLFPNLVELFLNHNKISEWHSINELNRLPRLGVLLFQYNPLLESATPQTIRELIIAKISSLVVLNKTKVTTNERRGAEIDYLKMFGAEWIKSGGNQEAEKNQPSEEFCLNHPRYQQLVNVYGAAEDSEFKKHSTTIKSSVISVMITSSMSNRGPLIKKLPGTMTVNRLKNLIQRLYKIDSDNIKLTYTNEKMGGPKVEFDNDFRELSFYSIENGDIISVEW